MRTRLTDELKAWIGREATYTAPEELGRASIRYFALALGDDNPVYSDPEFAKQTVHGDIIAPPTFVCETNQIINQPIDKNGYIGHDWPLPLSSSRFIRGGNEYELMQPVRASDRVTVTWKIIDIYERYTRKLGTLIFVVSEARYANQRGELLAVNRETNIYSP
ncbi:MAG TPA: MaoC family dehydratase N-terminal domain-containing protein [Candidatus Binataceae bacterium]|nr:MaoC family dehydratase N-terminal domain-containing protein [Candidatus Binataceae bacterium]